MYAITGITGKVGGAAARALLAADQPVRAVLRNRDKAKYWSNLGCEVILAAMEDAQALSARNLGSDLQGIPRIHMLDGFNEGWIGFEGGSEILVQGSVSLNDALGKLVADAV
jgi:NAD(P)-dependent dehydrogenase (short-subunit alcohol dehydrogenase family)